MRNIKKIVKNDEELEKYNDYIEIVEIDGDVELSIEGEFLVIKTKQSLH